MLTDVLHFLLLSNNFCELHFGFFLLERILQSIAHLSKPASCGHSQHRLQSVSAHPASCRIWIDASCVDRPTGVEFHLLMLSMCKSSLGLFKPWVGNDNSISFTKVDEYLNWFLLPSPCSPKMFRYDLSPTIVPIFKYDGIPLTFSNLSKNFFSYVIQIFHCDNIVRRCWREDFY